MAYIPIPQNPYIVGNPIQSAKMFYGRNEDFLYIRDKLDKETKGLIITLAGERRSGKTSILFQIMNGRLGPDFIPFFIDMQAMAAVESDYQFLARMDQCMRPSLAPDIPHLSFDQNGWKDFETLISSIQDSNPGRKLIFLLDEYELIENKIEKKLLSEELITFFANLMENHGVYFLFTGSNKLEERNTMYWKTLFSKSQYRKITFLKHNDCLDLITKPVEGFVHYTEEQQDKIWRLSAGQPFYTQIFCQNMVDRLQIEKRNEVLEEDIDAVIGDIVDNPMPQMIYFWQELEARHKLALSVLAEVLHEKEEWADSHKLINTLNAHKLNLAVSEKDLHTALEEMYHRDILSKKGSDYQFRVDIFRFWVKQEQNVWKLLREINLEKPKSSAKPYKFAIAAIFLVLIVSAALAFWLLKPKTEFGSTKNSEAKRLYKQANTYFEDANYSLALRTVEGALKADSLYFKACLLKADVLKAMNNTEEALPAYEKAERIYYKLASNVGKLLATLPDSLASSKAKEHWFQEGEFVYDSQYIRNLLFIQLQLPPKDVISDLHAYHLKSRKWINLPGSTMLTTQKHIVYYYNFQGNFIGAYDANRNKTLWKYQLPKIDNKYRYFLAEDGLIKEKSQYLIVFNRGGFWVLNPKTGKEIAQKQYPDNDLKHVVYGNKSQKLLVSTDGDRSIYLLPKLKLIKKMPINPGSGSRYFRLNPNFLTVWNQSIGRSEFYSFLPDRDSLDKITTTSQSTSYTFLDRAVYYTLNDTLYHYVYAKGTRKIVKLPPNQRIKSLFFNYSLQGSPIYAFALSDSNLFILSSKGKILHEIALTKLGEKNKAADPQEMSYDAKRKRLIFTTFVGEDTKSEARTLSVYDINKEELLYTVNISKSYGSIYCINNLYVLIDETEDFDDSSYYVRYNGLYMNPDTFQIMPSDDLKFLMVEDKRCLAIAGKRLYELTKYPASEEKSLQRIQENLLLLYATKNMNEKVLPTFQKMLAYLRSLNNPAVSQVLVHNLFQYAGDDLGYYASRLLAIDANFKTFKTQLEASMNLSPNSTLPALKLGDREYVRTYGNLLYTMQYNASYSEVSYYKIENGKKELMFKANRNQESSYSDEGIFVATLPNQKPTLYLWDKTGKDYAHPLPHNPQNRTTLRWLDDDTIFYVIQKQQGKGFNYELGTMDKVSGNKTIHKDWNSPLHLKSTVVLNKRLGLAFSDSVQALYYIPTSTSALLPPMAQIVSCNGKPVKSIDDLNPAAATAFNLEYLNNGQLSRITLSPMQLANSFFAPLYSTRLQWFDFTTKEFSAPVPFGQSSLKNSYFINYDHEDYIANKYLKLYGTIEAGEFFEIIDLGSGRITECIGFQYSADADIGYTWSSARSAFLSRIGPKQHNQMMLSYSTFTPDGRLAPVWTVPIPWKGVYIMDGTPTQLITKAYRQLESGDYSYALLYLNRKTGSIDRRVNLFSDTSVLAFDDKPLLLYDPQLGYYDPEPHLAMKPY